MAHHRVAFRRAVSYMAICARQRGAQGLAARPNALKPDEGAGARCYDVAERVDHTLALRAGALVVRAALKTRGACLGVPAARRGSFGLRAAVRRAARVGAHSGRACAPAPTARVLQRWDSDRLRWLGTCCTRLTRGSWCLFAGVCDVSATIV